MRKSSQGPGPRGFITSYSARTTTPRQDHFSSPHRAHRTPPAHRVFRGRRWKKTAGGGRISTSIFRTTTGCSFRSPFLAGWDGRLFASRSSPWARVSRTRVVQWRCLKRWCGHFRMINRAVTFGCHGDCSLINFGQFRRLWIPFIKSGYCRLEEGLQGLGTFRFCRDWKLAKPSSRPRKSRVILFVFSVSRI